MGSGVGVLAVVGVDAAVDLVELAEDAVLLAFEQVQWDRVGVVGVQETFLFVLEPVTVGGELVQLVGLVGHEPVELVVQHPAECFAVSGRDLHSLVVALDHVLDVFDEDRATGAVGAFGVPAGADEVGVDVAVAVLRVRDHQPGAAGAAEHGAFEVVVVELGGFGGALVGGEHGLHLVPDLGRHEGFVAALVAGAAVDHIALVIGVDQHPVHRGHRERLAGPFRGGHAGQPAGGELVVELADGPVP
nr:hypothetical protein [Cumulibacter manganitolerans]